MLQQEPEACTTMPDTLMSPRSDDDDTLMGIMSSPTSSVIDQVNETQKSRSKTRLNPLSSPSKHNRSRCQEFHHITNQERLQRSSMANPRNKHNKIRQVRSQHRYEKLALQREYISDKQDKEDFERKYDQKVREVMGNEDLDRLIEEENDMLNENKRSSFEIQEAEARAWEEEMELIELIDSLDLRSR